MSILNLFMAIGRAFAERRRRQRAYAELMALDDLSLADIGLHRSQIRALVEGDLARAEERAAADEAISYWPAQARLIGATGRPNL